MLEILARRVKAIQPTKETVDVTTHVLDAADLATHFGREFCSHVFSAFMLQYADRPRDVVRAIYQSLQPGGSLGLGLWGRKNGPMIIWSESCAETDLDHKVVKSDELLAWTDIGELETMLREGFRDMESEIQTLEFGCKTIEDLVEFWFSGSNPVARKFVQTWAEEGGDLEAVKRNYHVIVERHGDHRENKIDVILTTARK
jgi:SAM-dependent methyltransferase